MTIRHFFVAFVAALFIQAGVFAWLHRDLIYLRHPASVIVQDDPGTFARQAARALARPRLTVRHLDTIADAARQFGRSAQEIQALDRRLAADPSDSHVKLRLADALRRAGDSAGAERLYLEVLSVSRSRTP